MLDTDRLSGSFEYDGLLAEDISPSSDCALAFAWTIGEYLTGAKLEYRGIGFPEIPLAIRWFG